jgi:hypothetical protein
VRLFNQSRPKCLMVITNMVGCMGYWCSRQWLALFKEAGGPLKACLDEGEVLEEDRYGSWRLSSLIDG